MKICPTCQCCYDDTDFSCPKDHTALVIERAGTRLLIGKYHLECLLGRGDKGNAYEATDLELNSPIIAVELHGTKVIDDPQQMQRFHREARQAVRAGGQDVADIYDYGPLPNGGAYIVMERIVRDWRREHSITKPPLSTQPMIESPVALPHKRRESSNETSPVQSEAITVGSTEEETRTSPHDSLAASDAMARLTEEETLTFPAFETATHRVVNEDAAAIHKASTAQEPSLMPPAPPVMASTPSTDPDQSAQRTSPIVVEVPGRGAERNRHRPLIYGAALAAVAALAVATMWFAFNREQAPSPNLPTPSVTSSTTQSPLTSLPTTNAPVTEPISPASTKLASPATTIADEAPPATVTRRRSANVQANSARVVLGQILNHWIAATAQRNVEWQMSFYMPVLDTFYRQSDVSLDFVRQEKARLFSEAQTVEVRLLDEPQITFSEAGRVATMRFRLGNVTEGGGQNRPNEIRQELRWRKTDKGWKIFSERDL